MDMHREKVIAKYEADCARLAHEPWLIDTLTAERDRLAAENAELRKCAKGLKRRHNTIAKAYWETCAELTAANATLDALRELCGPNKTISNRTCMKMVDLLYPKPKETTDDAG